MEIMYEYADDILKRVNAASRRRHATQHLHRMQMWKQQQSAQRVSNTKNKQKTNKKAKQKRNVGVL